VSTGDVVSFSSSYVDPSLGKGVDYNMRCRSATIRHAVTIDNSKSIALTSPNPSIPGIDVLLDAKGKLSREDGLLRCVKIVPDH